MNQGITFAVTVQNPVLLSSTPDAKEIPARQYFEIVVEEPQRRVPEMLRWSCRKPVVHLHEPASLTDFKEKTVAKHVFPQKLI